MKLTASRALVTDGKHRQDNTVLIKASQTHFLLQAAGESTDRTPSPWHDLVPLGSQHGGDPARITLTLPSPHNAGVRGECWNAFPVHHQAPRARGVSACLCLACLAQLIFPPPRSPPNSLLPLTCVGACCACAAIRLASRPMLVVYQHHAFMQFLQIPAEPSHHEGSCGHAAAPIAGGRRNATRNLLVLLVKTQWASGLACCIGRIRSASAIVHTPSELAGARKRVRDLCA